MEKEKTPGLNYFLRVGQTANILQIYDAGRILYIFPCLREYHLDYVVLK